MAKKVTTAPYTGKSFIRTGGEWVEGSWNGHARREDCDCPDPTMWPRCERPYHSYYRGGICEPGRFTSLGAPEATDPIRQLLKTDGKLYKDFMRACQHPIIVHGTEDTQ